MLWASSILWTGIVVFRGWLYDCGIKKALRLPAKVIGIGNITAGGTGKTPFTIALAQELTTDSRQIAIVLRSYKATQNTPLEVLLDTPASIAGDEALVIKRKIPWAMVCVAKDKSKAALFACKKGASLILVDDSFQHRKLAFDEQFVIIDSDNPFGYGFLLPRGLLREPLQGLKRATSIVINCRKSSCKSRDIEKNIRAFTHAPIMKMNMEASGVFDMNDAFVHTSLKGVPVGVFCGIGNPAQFLRMAQSFDCEILGTLFFQDHQYVPDKLEAFAAAMKRKGALALLCTEKDKVKIKKEPELPLFWVGVQATLHNLPYANWGS